jgi:hypothetical protein
MEGSSLWNKGNGLGTPLFIWKLFLSSNIQLKRVT